MIVHADSNVMALHPDIATAELTGHNDFAGKT